MKRIRKHFSEVDEALSLIDTTEIENVVRVLRIVKQAGKRVYVFGNGGSHATATHFVNDLVKQNRIKAHCVGSEAPTVFAYGNDNGWENMFRDPLVGKLETGDCLFGISCSGNSENVVRALELAVVSNGFAVGLTGASEHSAMAKLGMDAIVYVPVEDIRVQEDAHLIICHSIVRALQEAE